MQKPLKRKERLQLGLLKLGEIAALANVLPSHIRYYSNLGLLIVADKTQGEYRLFKKDETLARFALIEQMKASGKTLDNIVNELNGASPQADGQRDVTGGA